MRKLVLGAALVLMLAGVGCGDSGPATCEEMCQKANDLGCQAAPADCATACQKTAALNAAANCGSQYDALLQCAGENPPSACGSHICGVEVGTYTACAMQYCSAQPTPPECQ
jgi:hypothetical protein